MENIDLKFITKDFKRKEPLPSYVKCMFCGEGPKWDDWLGEWIKNSTALAHESCAKKRGRVFGFVS